MCLFKSFCVTQVAANDQLYPKRASSVHSPPTSPRGVSSHLALPRRCADIPTIVLVVGGGTGRGSVVSRTL
jgi:hypothetical protein